MSANDVFGLDLIIDIDDPTCGYEFSAFGVFIADDGRLFTATDSGCSCYSAWEDAPDFEPVESIGAAERRAHEWADGSVAVLDAVNRAFREYRRGAAR